MSSAVALAPLLLPAPQRLHCTGGRVALRLPLRINGPPPFVAAALPLLGRLVSPTAPADHPAIELRPSPSQPADGYTLIIAADATLRIDASDAAGARQGAATLAQLLRQYGAQLPCLAIEDAPRFATRGVMLDISRDRVPTMAELHTLIDTLASWKINHLQFYTEHAFAYVGHEAVWADASPLTPAEVRELDAHAQTVGITLAANQNCLGHLSRFFAHPRYAALAEIPLGQSWDFGGIGRKTGPFSLCPSDPGTQPFLRDLLAQLLPCFTAPMVNIGCDEAYDLGQGRSAAAVAARGRASVYLDHVRAVCGLVREHGRTPQFWADIALEHPDALAELPADLTALAWGYEPDAPFARWCDQIRGVDRAVWVCPGTSCWCSITGRTAERRANLAAAAAAADHGASGFLITAWGDDGHRQQWPVTLRGLADGAQHAWSGAPGSQNAASLHAFGDLATARWLDDLGDCDRELRLICGAPTADGAPTRLRNKSALFMDLHRPLSLPLLGTPQGWRDAFAYLLPLREAPGNDAQLHDELVHTWQVAAFACRRALLRDRSLTADERRCLSDDLHAIGDEHARLWRLRSRPGGLNDSLAHYLRIAEKTAG